MNHVAKGRQVLRIEADALKSMVSRLGREFDAAVRLLMRAVEGGGKIVATGVGKNLHVAEKVSATFASTGSPSVVLNPSQAMHGDIGIVCASDVLLAFSYSGETDELVSLLQAVRRIGAKVVTVTGSPRSALAKLSDVAVPAPVRREACPFNLAPTTSTTVAMAVGDALAMVLLDARGFRREDYARLHPAGAIGRTLLMRVSDIMRTGNRVPRVRVTATVQDAIMVMTRARTGAAAVVSEKGRLCGVFTDGDLRRNLPKHPDVLKMKICDVMTKRPITVREDRLAAEAVRIFEEHKIDDLLVVDRKGRLVGTIDSQDLPGLKIL